MKILREAGLMGSDDEDRTAVADVVLVSPPQNRMDGDDQTLPRLHDKGSSEFGYV